VPSLDSFSPSWRTHPPRSFSRCLRVRYIEFVLLNAFVGTFAPPLYQLRRNMARLVRRLFTPAVFPIRPAFFFFKMFIPPTRGIALVPLKLVLLPPSSSFAGFFPPFVFVAGLFALLSRAFFSLVSLSFPSRCPCFLGWSACPFPYPQGCAAVVCFFHRSTFSNVPHSARGGERLLLLLVVGCYDRKALCFGCLVRYPVICFDELLPVTQQAAFLLCFFLGQPGLCFVGLFWFF